MSEINQTPINFRFQVSSLNSGTRANKLKNILQTVQGIGGVEADVEQRILTWTADSGLDLSAIKKRLAQDGFHLQTLSAKEVAAASSLEVGEKKFEVCVDGMTCRSCELTIERAWQKIPGVKSVDVNLSNGKARICTEPDCSVDCKMLSKALPDKKYSVYLPGERRREPVVESGPVTIPQLIGLFALVILLGTILSKFGVLKPNFDLGSSTSFGAIFVIGLVAASSSCVAVVGGLLLSVSAKFNERYASQTGFARLRPVVLFVLGRVIGYSVLGGLLGVVGGILTPSPLVTAIITIIAAVYMIIMGLEMLHIAPHWLKRLLPRMPKSLSHRIVDAESKDHPLTPLFMGAATFFLPCGFTQALQLYALTTGSFWASSSIMLAFALGTAPALLALGYASSSLKGKFGKFFFRFSGALVIVLGLWNIQNGLTIAGYPISFSGLVLRPTTSVEAAGKPSAPVNGEQTIKMRADGRGYTPNRLSVSAGAKVRWEITGDSNGIGCAAYLQSRQLGVSKLLQPGLNVIEFKALYS